MTTSLPIVRVREDVLRGLFDSAYALAVRRAPLTGGCADPTFTPSPSSAYGWRALDVLSGEVNHSPQSMCRSSSSPPSHLRLNHVCHRVEELRWWSPPPSLSSTCARRSERSAQFRHPKFNNCLIFLARARALLHLHLHRVRSTRLSAIPLRLASDVRSAATCGGGPRCLCTERLDVVSVCACVFDSRGTPLIGPFPVSIAPSVLNALDTTYRDALASAPSSDEDNGEGVGVSLRRKWTTTRVARSGGHGYVEGQRGRGVVGGAEFGVGGAGWACRVHEIARVRDSTSISGGNDFAGAGAAPPFTGLAVEVVRAYAARRGLRALGVGASARRRGVALY
ncbi:hypothetical protein B0H16DRAFT_1727322 [Mycena metata]|uniref:Uncharacterized protein n=1 Tax=Mycena metata TaxID=1033252 RepID=A0AAD7IJ60_9AGAR|nr:hypothetical protein B0H16DRAFT_1727322 [Mycena metata]